jgi:putative endonuclease
VIEVRSRATARFGTAAESVDARKQAKLAALGARFVQQSGWSGPWRIDVIAYDGGDDGIPRLEHYRDAVSGG